MTDSDGLAKALRAFADFENAMKRVLNLAKVTEEDIMQMKAEVESMQRLGPSEGSGDLVTDSDRSIWIVTSGWQGNGMEAAIVDAATEAEALDAAAEALIADADTDLARSAERSLGRDIPEWQVKHHAEKIESYQSRDQFRAEHITLPHVTEVG